MKDTDLPKGQGFYRKQEGGTIYVHIHGKNYCCETKIPDAAEVFRAKKMVQITAGMESAGRMSAIFRDYVTHLKENEAEGGEYAQDGTTTSYRTQSVINCHLDPFFGKMKLEDVRFKLHAYKALRKKQGAPATSYNGEFRILRAALNVAAGVPKFDPSVLPSKYPFDGKKERKQKRKGIITPEQRDAILNESAPHLAVIFGTFINTGVRPKELRHILDTQVVLDGPKPKFNLLDGQTKNGEGGPVAIDDELRDILIRWREKTKREYPDCPYFFHYRGKKIGSTRTAWEGALRRSGLRVYDEKTEKWHNTVLFYDSRRSASTQMDVDDVNAEDRKKQMRHKTDSESDKYNRSEKFIDRVRDKKNAALRARGYPTREPATAPMVPEAATAKSTDWKAELRELKTMLDDGMLTADEFTSEKAKVMAAR